MPMLIGLLVAITVFMATVGLGSIVEPTVLTWYDRQ